MILHLLLYLYAVTLLILSVFRSALAYRSALTVTWTKCHKPSILTPWGHSTKRRISVKQNIVLCKNILIAVQTMHHETLKSRFAEGQGFVFHFHFYSQTHSTSAWKKNKAVLSQRPSNIMTENLCLLKLILFLKYCKCKNNKEYCHSSKSCS